MGERGEEESGGGPAEGGEPYTRVVVCRRVLSRRAPKDFFPVWSAVRLPGKKDRRNPAGRTYWVSAFPGSQEQAERMARRIAHALWGPEPEEPPMQDDGYEGAKRVKRAFEEREAERRRKRKEARA